MTARRLELVAAALFVLVRVAAFPSAKSYQGDGLTRLDVAARWAARPHVIVDPEEVWVIGPLQAVVDGVGVRLAGRDLGSRLPSLVLGCLLVVPLLRLGRRTGARHGGALAVGLVAVYGLHVQSSTTAASEALFLTPLLYAVERALAMCDAEAPRVVDAALAGVALAVAEALRYDGWLYAALACAVVLAARPRARATAVLVALAAAFPVAWMATSLAHTGRALWFYDAYAAFHREFARRQAAALGAPWFRAVALVYWPAALAVTFSPVAAALGVVGAARSWRTRRCARLLLVLFAPALLLSLRAAILVDVGLVARFTMVGATALAVLAGVGAEALGRRAWLAALVVAVAVPVAFAAASHRRSGRLAERIRAVSPLADLPPAVEDAAAWLRAHPDRAPILVDNDGSFAAMALAEYGGLVDAGPVRVGAPGWQDDLARRPPACAALLDGGALGATGAPAARIDGRTLRLAASFPSAPGGEAVYIYCSAP